MRIKKIVYAGIIGLFLLLYTFFDSVFGADNTLVNEYLSSPSTTSATTKYGSLASDLYTSKIQTVEGYTRMRGMIITDGSAAPTLCYINQLAGGTNTAVWHGTDTVAFVQTGSIWRGEIDFPVFGRFVRAKVGGFGNATFFSMNWFITNNEGRDLATKWIDQVSIIGTVTSQLAPQSSSRKYVLITNEGTANDVYISGNTPVVPGSGAIIVKKNNGYWEESNGVFYDAIYAVTSSGTTSVRLTELK